MEKAWAFANSDNREGILEALVDLYEKDVVNLAFTYVKDWSTAEDITQEVFLKIYKKMHTFEDRSNVKTWIYRIAINQCKDFLKSRYVRSIFLTNRIQRYSGRDDKGAEGHLLKSLENAELARSVFQLPVKLREVILLFYYKEFTIEEISETLNISSSAARTRLSRARDALRKLHGRSGENG
ncbi:sigma-70 family RNA polymerase sigma factor [Peribacillus kribbensis]|uniref:sigma-70 family RNA polymerase sigma factor n=1 Tax=Peribacillus kribbensis TaxID=356658 RepID=UPI000409C009|nr:sigma-70 family RNA polymerase sigma factor [Peribacillus kribbensis]